MTISATLPAIRLLARWSILMLVLVAISACQSSSAAKPQTPQPASVFELQTPQPGPTTASATNTGETIFTEIMLEGQAIKLQVLAEKFECVSPTASSSLNLKPRMVKDPAEALAIGAFEKYTIVCVAILDRELRQQTARIVITLEDGATIPVSTNGEGGLIVPLLGEKQLYKLITFYDQNDAVKFEYRCKNMRCPK